MIKLYDNRYNDTGYRGFGFLNVNAEIPHILLNLKINRVIYIFGEMPQNEIVAKHNISNWKF